MEDGVLVAQNSRSGIHSCICAYVEKKGFTLEDALLCNKNLCGVYRGELSRLVQYHGDAACT